MLKKHNWMNSEMLKLRMIGHAPVIPIGDVSVDKDKDKGKDKLTGEVEWEKNEPHAKVEVDDRRDRISMEEEPSAKVKIKDIKPEDAREKETESR